VIVSWQAAFGRDAAPNIRWRGPVTRGALLLMETLWAYALVAFWVALLSGGGKPTPLGVAAIVFGSFLISRGLQQSNLELGLIRVWGALISFLAFYAIVRVDFYGDWRFWDFGWADQLFYHVTATVRENQAAVFGLPLLWLLWLRGVLRSQQSIAFDSVVGSFAVGVLIIGFVQVLEGAVHAPPPVRQVAMPYVAIGLLAIGLAHAARAEDRFGRSFAPTWFGAVAGAVVLIGGLAALFAIVDFGPLTDAVHSISYEIGWVFGKTLYVVLWPFVKGAEFLVEGWRWFFENIFGGERNPNQGQDVAVPPPEEAAGRRPGALDPWLDLLLRIIVLGGLAALALVGTALLFDRFLRRARPGEVKESTYQEGRLGADLGDLLGSVLGRLRPHARASRDQLDPARRLYFEMLAEGAQRGVERQPPETPLELAPRLSETFAAETPARITSVFDEVRYGGAPPPEDEVRRLRQEWERLKGG